VDEETAAIDAFQLMVTKDVDGLAVCNKEGRLRGNISLRDRQSGEGKKQRRQLPEPRSNMTAQAIDQLSSLS